MAALISVLIIVLVSFYISILCEFDDAVYVIGHDDVFVEDGFGEVLGDGQPAVIGYFASFVEVHFAVFDFSKKVGPVLTAKCDKVKAFTAIVVAFEPYAAAVVFFRIVAVHVFLVNILFHHLLYHSPPSPSKAFQ
jgi:hypothetical protein